MKQYLSLLITALLAVSLFGCAAESAPTGTTTAATTTTSGTTAPIITDDPTVTSFTAAVGGEQIFVDLQTPDGYLATVRDVTMALPSGSDTATPASMEFIATGELEYLKPQRSIRLSRMTAGSNAYVVQLTAGFFPSAVYSAIRKDATWEPIGDITSATGVTYSAFRAGDAYYLVTALEGTDLCVVLDTAKGSEAIDRITFTVR